MAVIPSDALNARSLRRAAGTLARREPRFAAILGRPGPPPLWAREPGFATLLFIILEQQVSLASARAAYDRVDARVGGVTPAALLDLSDAELRADGLPRDGPQY